ncbi:hypothetical protein QJQ45_025227 [Haematococcus lacustris]|nr:hypothetical protein QJQ45_025227 [Haematococcus lacustris]
MSDEDLVLNLNFESSVQAGRRSKQGQKAGGRPQDVNPGTALPQSNANSTPTRNPQEGGLQKAHTGLPLTPPQRAANKQGRRHNSAVQDDSSLPTANAPASQPASVRSHQLPAPAGFTQGQQGATAQSPQGTSNTKGGSQGQGHGQGQGQGRGRGGGQGQGRGGAHGRGRNLVRGKPGPGADQDELDLRGADSDEEGAVARMVAAVSAREAAVRAELGVPAGAAAGADNDDHGQGVVDFDGDTHKLRGGSRKQRKPEAQQVEDARPGRDGVKGSKGQQRGREEQGGRRERIVKPGGLVHAGAGREAAGVFGDDLEVAAMAGAGELAGVKGKGEEQGSVEEELDARRASYKDAGPSGRTAAVCQERRTGSKGRQQQPVQGQHAADTADTAQVPAKHRAVTATKTGAAPGAVGQGQPGVAAGVAAEGGGAWVDLGVPADLAQQLVGLGFLRPTLVQRQALPALMSRRDVLVRAPTGSGKTLAYLVPMVADLAGQVGGTEPITALSYRLTVPTALTCLTACRMCPLLVPGCWLLQEPRLSRADGTFGLVLAPTRELSLQIQDVALQLMRKSWWLVAGVLIGGENRNHEKSRLRKGLSLVSATPGRLLDHLENTNCLHIGRLRWLVLDEADRLLDLGFEVKLRQILALLDARQAAAAAAGLNQDKAGSLLLGGASSGSNPASGTPGAVETTNMTAGSGSSPPGGLEQFQLPSQLRQSFMEVEDKQRLVTLAGLLRQKLMGGGRGGGGAGLIGQPLKAAGHASAAGSAERRKAVVFLSSCDGVELHWELLGRCWHSASGGPLLGREVPLLKLHGDMPQAQRTSSFVTFSEAPCAVLLCTDVAARGLDFPDVTVIIQYDVPGAPSE